MTQTKQRGARVTAVRILGLVVAMVLLVAGCSGNAASSVDTTTAGATASADCQALEAELETVTAERDALREGGEIAADAIRYEKSLETQALLVEIIGDPDAFGTEEEVLAALNEIAVDGAVMNDSAFGAAGVYAGWSNTLYGGLDSKIPTWVTWMCDDGLMGGSLWTWMGTARNGEPFELIGVDVSSFTDDGKAAHIDVDWPYEGAFVRDAVAKGNAVASVGVEQVVGVELPAAAAKALDNYGAAVVAADGEVMLNYVTDEFTFLSYGTDVQEREFWAAYVTKNYGSFSVESIGDRMVLGGGDTYVVSEPERATKPALVEGFSTYRLVNRDGEWLVDVHRFTGE